MKSLGFSSTPRLPNGSIGSNLEPGGNLCKAQLTVLRALGLPFDSFGYSGAQTSSTVDGMLV